MHTHNTQNINYHSVWKPSLIGMEYISDKPMIQVMKRSVHYYPYMSVRIN